MSNSIKKYIKSITEQLNDLDETNVTGNLDGGAGPPKTPFAFTDDREEDKEKEKSNSENSTGYKIVKKAPKKVTNAIDISVVGQKTIDAGTQASGGIGLKISNGGKKMSLKYLLTAKANPKGIPIICAIIKPAKTLPELIYQLSQ